MPLPDVDANAPLLPDWKHAQNVALQRCVRQLAVANRRYAMATTAAQRARAWQIANEAEARAFRAGVGPELASVRTEWAAREYCGPADLSIGNVIAAWQQYGAVVPDEDDDTPLDNKQSPD